MLTEIEEGVREGFEMAGLRTFWPERWLVEVYLGGELTLVLGDSDAEERETGLLVSLDSIVNEWSKRVLGAERPHYEDVLRICQDLRLQLFGLAVRDDELDRPVHWLQRDDVDRVLSAILYTALNSPSRRRKGKK